MSMKKLWHYRVVSIFSVFAFLFVTSFSQKTAADEYYFKNSKAKSPSEYQTILVKTYRTKEAANQDGKKVKCLDLDALAKDISAHPLYQDIEEPCVVYKSDDGQLVGCLVALGVCVGAVIVAFTGAITGPIIGLLYWGGVIGTLGFGGYSVEVAISPDEIWILDANNKNRMPLILKGVEDGEKKQILELLEVDLD